MTPLQITLLICGIVVIDAIVVYFVFRGVGGDLRALAKKHPTQPPTALAVRREFQSVSIGLCNLGFCVHLTVDERYLHIDPTLFARVLLGMGPMSIPWNAIRVVSSRGRRCTAIQVSMTDIVAPKWAIEAGMGSKPVGAAGSSESSGSAT